MCLIASPRRRPARPARAPDPSVVVASTSPFARHSRALADESGRQQLAPTAAGGSHRGPRAVLPVNNYALLNKKRGLVVRTEPSCACTGQDPTTRQLRLLLAELRHSFELFSSPPDHPGRASINRGLAPRLNDRLGSPPHLKRPPPHIHRLPCRARAFMHRWAPGASAEGVEGPEASEQVSSVNRSPPTPKLQRSAPLNSTGLTPNAHRRSRRRAPP